MKIKQDLELQKIIRNDLDHFLYRHNRMTDKQIRKFHKENIDDMIELLRDI